MPPAPSPPNHYNGTIDEEVFVIAQEAERRIPLNAEEARQEPIPEFAMSSCEEEGSTEPERSKKGSFASSDAGKEANRLRNESVQIQAQAAGSNEEFPKVHDEECEVQEQEPPRARFHCVGKGLRMRLRRRLNVTRSPQYRRSNKRSTKREEQ